MNVCNLSKHFLPNLHFWLSIKFIKFFIQFSRTDTSSFSGRLSAVVVDVLVGCLIYWSNKDENPFNQNNREQASVEGSECDNLVTQPDVTNLKSNFILKHLKSIELKILWNHILKPVHDVKMAKPGQPCNYFCLLKKVFYFFFSYEIRIFGAVEFEKIVILKKGVHSRNHPLWLWGSLPCFIEPYSPFLWISRQTQR